MVGISNIDDLKCIDKININDISFWDFVIIMWRIGCFKVNNFLS